MMLFFVGKKTLCESNLQEEGDDALIVQQDDVDLPSTQHSWSYGIIGSCGDFANMAWCKHMQKFTSNAYEIMIQPKHHLQLATPDKLSKTFLNVSPVDSL